MAVRGKGSSSSSSSKRNPLLGAVRCAATVAAVGWGLRAFMKRFVAVRAWQKFNRAGGWFGIYATIPLISGLLNWATNKLAVWMIFSPLEFKGVEWLPRKEFQPGTLFGWQGIVPAKVKKMGGDIAELLLTQLLDIKAVFARLDAARLAKLLTPGLAPTVTALIKQEFFGDSAFDLGASGNDRFRCFVEEKVETIMARIVDKIKADPERFIDMRNLLRDLQQNKLLIVELFQKCGREELKFVVNTGLYGGMALGLLQMAVWLVWNPPWTLAAGGAFVGYATNWLALKIMFEPVDPVFSLGTFKFQGLFLQRQAEVADEFSTFVERELLQPAQLWRELAGGARSDALARAVAVELAEDPLWALADMKDSVVSYGMQWYSSYSWLTGGKTADEAAAAQKTTQKAVGRDFKRLAAVIVAAIPAAADDNATTEYVDGALQLRETLRQAMLKMSSAEFEKVLHPIFQEDETTLIAVGTALGAAAGFAQVPFY